MKSNGEGKRQVTDLGGRMIFPDFSPDATRIVFAGRLPGGTNDDIWLTDADGTDADGTDGDSTDADGTDGAAL